MRNTEPSDGLAAFIGVSTVKESRLWLREYARKLSIDYRGLMVATADLLENGRTYSAGNKHFLVLAKEFWHHYQVVTNCHLMEEDKQNTLAFTAAMVKDRKIVNGKHRAK